jgi:hypothetical protein
MIDTLIVLLPISALLVIEAILTYYKTMRRERAIVALIARTLQDTFEK